MPWYVEIIKELGLPGIVGTSVGFFLSKWLKRWGKLRIHTKNARLAYAAATKLDWRDGINRAEADRAELVFDLEVFCAREEPVGLRAFRVEARTALSNDA